MVALIFVITPKDAGFLLICYFGREEKLRSFFLALFITADHYMDQGANVEIMPISENMFHL